MVFNFKFQNIKKSIYSIKLKNIPCISFTMKTKKMLWCLVIFLITLLLSSLYHNSDVYESIIHFILAYVFLNLIETHLPTFKTFIKDSCGRLIILLDYVKNFLVDKPSPNLPNLNPIIPNPMPNSPSLILILFIFMMEFKL